jgi:hypothetical protein
MSERLMALSPFLSDISKAHRDPSDSLLRFRFLFYRMSLPQNRGTLLRDML